MKRLPASLIAFTVLVTLFVFRLTATTSPAINAQDSSDHPSVAGSPKDAAITIGSDADQSSGESRKFVLKRNRASTIVAVLRTLFADELAENALHIEVDPFSETISVGGKTRLLDRVVAEIERREQTKGGEAATTDKPPQASKAYGARTDVTLLAATLKQVFAGPIADKVLSVQAEAAGNNVLISGTPEAVEAVLTVARVVDRTTPQLTKTGRLQFPSVVEISRSGIEEQLAVFQRKLAEVRLDLAQAEIELQRYEAKVASQKSVEDSMSAARIEAALAAHPEIVKRIEQIGSAEATMAAVAPGNPHYEMAKKTLETGKKKLEETRNRLIPAIHADLAQQLQTERDEAYRQVHEKVTRIAQLEKSVSALIASSVKQLAEAETRQAAERARVSAEVEANLSESRHQAAKAEAVAKSRSKPAQKSGAPGDGESDKSAPAILIPFEHLDGSEAVATLSSLYPNLFNAGGIVLSGKSLWIRAAGDDLTAVTKTLREMERLAQNRQSESIIKVFSLRNLRATSFKEILLALYPNASVGMSPDDRSNALIVRGPEDLLREFEAIGLKLDSADAQPGAVAPSPNSKPDPDIYNQRNREAAAQAKACLELAAKGGAVTEDERLALKAKLRTAVAAAYDARKQLRESEVASLRHRLQQLEQQITARDTLREQIIDNRVEELLNPEKQWESRETEHTVPGT